MRGIAVAAIAAISVAATTYMFADTSTGRALAWSIRDAVIGRPGPMPQARSGSEEGVPAAGSGKPYEEYADNYGCSGGDCNFLHFKPVPAGKRLEISSASCRYVSHLDSHVLNSYFIVEKKTGASAIVELVPFFLGNCVGGADCSVSAANHETFFFIRPGGSYYLYSGATADLTDVSCTIAGHMVSVP
jgi:hypothetical protein